MPRVKAAVRGRRCFRGNSGNSGISGEKSDPLCCRNRGIHASHGICSVKIRVKTSGADAVGTPREGTRPTRSRSLGPRGPLPLARFLSPLPKRLKSRSQAWFRVSGFESTADEITKVTIIPEITTRKNESPKLFTWTALSGIVRLEFCVSGWRRFIWPMPPGTVATAWSHPPVPSGCRSDGGCCRCASGRGGC
jgi:hypothetical protein